MASRSPRPAAHSLAPALRTLGPKHRRRVAETIGAARDTPDAIAAVLTDEEALSSIVAGLDDGARRLVTRTAFAPLNAWSTGRHAIEPEVAQTLECHGLLFAFEAGWGLTLCTPLELEAPLRHIRARAHAAHAPDADVPDGPPIHAPEQMLHDAAQVASVIGAGGIQLKADGELFARAVPKLVSALTPLAIHMPGLADARMNLALELLEQNGALRVRGTGLPGAASKRELALALDVAALFAVPAADRARLMDAIDRRARPGKAIVNLLLDAFAGRTVALHDVGASLMRLFDEADKRLPDPGASVSEESLALAILCERWLRGDVGLSVDAEGTPVAAVFASEKSEDPSGPPCLAQGDFELVMMRPVTPAERAALLSVAEPVAGREHVARITKARVWDALRADGAVDVAGRLRSLSGTLPQNVEQTVLDWARRAPRRVRLRSAMMLDAPDEQTAERLASVLGSMLAERLSPTLLAVDAGELRAVTAAVARAGVELEEGLDRVSGTWADRPDRDAHPTWWRPTPGAEQPAAPPAGRIVSRVDWKPEPPPEPVGGGDPARRRAAADLARHLAKAGFEPADIELVLGQDYDEDDDDDDDDDDEITLEDVLLLAHDRDGVVRIAYAGAGGLHHEWVTIVRFDDARVEVRDNATGKLSWRWLRSITEAELVS